MNTKNVMTLQEIASGLISAGYSQTSLAAASGLPQPTISRILAGRGVSYDNGKRLETFYNSAQQATKTTEPV